MSYLNTFVVFTVNENTCGEEDNAGELFELRIRSPFANTLMIRNIKNGFNAIAFIFKSSLY